MESEKPPMSLKIGRCNSKIARINGTAVALSARNMPMPSTYHFVASAHPGLTPLSNDAVCARLWQRLMLRFPEAWAAVFMPDHIHLIIETDDPIEARRLIAIEARAAGRAFYPGKAIWAPLPLPERLNNSGHLSRTIRYVHLNPCRERLASDPLEWEWSTHRDVLGAVTQSWINLNRLAGLFGCSKSVLPGVFHGYVSADPSVAVTGTPLLRGLEPGAPLSASAQICIRSVAAVSRAHVGEVLKRRSLRDAAAVLAVQHARNSRDSVEAALKIDKRTLIRALARTVGSNAIAAARLYLGDPRCYRLRGVR